MEDEEETTHSGTARADRRYGETNELVGGLATRRQQPRLYLPLNTSRVPSVPEAPGSPRILGSSVARRNMHNRVQSIPKSPLATSTASSPLT
jgi:hypothetical protein